MEALYIDMYSVKPDSIVMKGKVCKIGIDNTYKYVIKRHVLN